PFVLPGYSPFHPKQHANYPLLSSELTMWRRTIESFLKALVVEDLALLFRSRRLILIHWRACEIPHLTVIRLLSPQVQFLAPPSSRPGRCFRAGGKTRIVGDPSVPNTYYDGLKIITNTSPECRRLQKQY